MTDYIGISLANAFRQILGGLGAIYMLAFVLWCVSRKRRGIGAGVLGRAYWCIVSPGVSFHKLSHAIGCWLTFTRVYKIVLFEVKDGHLGYITHSEPNGNILGPNENFVHCHFIDKPSHLLCLRDGSDLCGNLTGTFLRR